MGKRLVSREAAIAGVVILVAAGGAAYAYSQQQKKPSGAVYAITISADKASGDVPFTVDVTGVASDSQGKAVAGTILYVFVALQGQSGSNLKSTTTQADGSYSFAVTFNEPGTYQVWVSNLTSGD